MKKSNILTIVLALVAVAAIIFGVVTNGQKTGLQKEIEDLKANVQKLTSDLDAAKKEAADAVKATEEAVAAAKEEAVKATEEAVAAVKEEAAKAMEEARELEKELKSFRMPAAPVEPAAPIPDSCIGSHTGCAIYWNGEMGTCISMNRYQHTKPFETGFEAAWAQLKAEQDKTFRRPNACQVCSMAKDCLHNCAGRRFEGTGSPYEPDPYTCQYTWLLRRYKARHEGADVPQSPECV